ncbi:phenylalanine--tRNA ligase subunit beta [Companilactobacillus nantensis]|uniref:Phenylalanine--tRNA ligase beta subunit n=1 Tax=Companilactobacillus nantensis DSM 16982 TaxID=1423774 RepID=A0A0R1WB83_9LACO|nr:phenylalanine--tRNA ligase subunit beta [Companilactobacillus nantensis]KRM15198.1 phenylalanyl-tRNA synthetase subunit beta [Companilactobacillus nantensis DSM 16982]GEO63563.1 phenylalanine--tRNA ligase beta subunit [Companilactobacillus nantensis]
MKISVNWLKEYIPVNHTVEEMANKISLTGIESGPVKLGEELTNLVVGHITSVVPHPDSDHLKVCQVDVGESEDIQIVCGAPNVAVGQYVIVALHGAQLPGGVKIKRGKLRGQESNGMICGLDEVGVPTQYMPKEFENGIYVFDEPQTPGDAVYDLLGLKDQMIDIDITPNRADTLGMRGAAWEIGATYNEKPTFTKPELAADKVKDMSDVTVDVAEKKLVPDYLLRELKDVTVGKSPLWMQRRLWNQNIRPVNSIIDAANYVMIEYGQPIQTFDLDKLAAQNLTVKFANDGDKLKLADGEKDLTHNDLVIVAGDQILGLAGVQNSIEATVDENTKNVLVEAGVFDGASVRKTAQRHDLRGDASNRFEKGVDNGIVDEALTRVAQLIDQTTTVKEISNVITGNFTKAEPTIIKGSASHINRLMGLDLATDEIVAILDRLGFNVDVNGDALTVTIPTRRWDMEIEADLVEEVNRIYGYENLPNTLPAGMETRGGYDPKRELANKLRDILLGEGMDEVINFSLLSKQEVEDFNIDNSEFTKLLHPMTEDHEYLRNSLIPGLVRNVAYNQARKNDDLKIFEHARVFQRVTGQDRPSEITYLSGAISGNVVTDSWNTTAQPVDFYYVKGIVEELLAFTNADAEFTFVATSEYENMHPGQTAKILANGQVIGLIGKLHPNYQTAHNVKDTFVFELNVDMLFDLNAKSVKAQTAPKYPSISRDLAILVAKNIENGQIVADIFANGGKYLKDVNIFDVYEGKNIKPNHKSLGYHLEFQNPNDTLTDDEVEKAFSLVKDSLAQKFNVEIR